LPPSLALSTPYRSLASLLARMVLAVFAARKAPSGTWTRLPGAARTLPSDLVSNLTT